MIVTNGVDFTLVAGACCLIKFSNALTSSGLNSSVTLNVNSTGAKKFRSYDKRKYSNNDSQQWAAMVVSLDTIPLIMYNGSTWENNCYAYYGDYTD